MLAVPSAVAYAQTCDTVMQGLVGYWTMNETSGDTLVDRSTNGNDGQWNDATDNIITTEAAAGAVGGALDFENGDDAYVTVSPSASINDTAAQTVCLWFNTESFLSGYKALVDKSDASDVGWNVYLYGAGERIGYYTRRGGYVELANGSMIQDQWQHFCGTWDGSDGFGGITMYLDGVAQAGSYTGDNSGSTMSDAANDLYFAGGPSDGGNGFDGLLDNIMIFNRELDATEVAAIYNGQAASVLGAEGAILFNEDHALMQYCDGTDWRMMGVGSYIPNGIQFDGSTTSLSHASPLTDVVDGKTFTGSFWYQNDEFGSEIVIQSDGATFMIKAQDWGSGPRLTFRTENQAGTVIMQYEVDAPEDANWHHVLFSFDQANPANNRLYLDGVSETFYEYGPGTPIDDLIDFTRPSIHFGFNSSAEHYDGKIADFWLETNLFLDLDIEANRRKFISETGMPMYLGEDGSIPTGVSPDIFLSGDTADWHTNKGTAGGFTEAGTLAKSAIHPGNNIVSYTDPDNVDLANGLVGHWTLDDTTGTNVVAAVGADGTFAGAANVNPQPGAVGGALNFDGFGDIVTVPNSASLEGFTELTVSAWILPTALPQSNWSRIVSKSNGTTGDDYAIMVNGSNQFNMRVTTASSVNGNTTSTLPLNTWTHVTGIWTGSNIDVYLNGVEESSAAFALSGAIQQSGAELAIGSHADGPTNRNFTGLIDDVRIYNRALTADELLTLAEKPPAGVIRYNSSFNAMTYYNGAEWVFMGPAKLDVPTSGLVAHYKLDDGSGTTATDSAGSHDGTLSGSVAFQGDGVIGGSLDAFGAGTVTIPNHADLDVDAGESFSFGGWFRKSDTDYFEFITKSNGSIWYALRAEGSPQHRYRCYVDDGTDTVFTSYVDGADDGEWHHVMCVINRAANTLSLYQDGVLINYGADISAVGSLSSVSDLELGAVGAGAESDDVRFYNRALSGTEVKTLYDLGKLGGGELGAGPCASPSGVAGQMIYNGDNNVMQYCNGAEWIRIGE